MAKTIIRKNPRRWSSPLTAGWLITPTKIGATIGSYLFVGIGGFVGAIARYWISQSFAKITSSTGFPAGTLAVNVFGCLLIGILAHLIDKVGLGNQELRLLLITGIIGGFTTFSAFSTEALALLNSDEFAMGLAYIGLSIGLGLAAVWLGQNSAARIL